MKAALAACTAALALLACGSSQPSKPAPIEPPIARLHFDNDFGLIFVTVLVGDTPHELLLDSGVAQTVLDPGLGSNVSLDLGGVLFKPREPLTTSLGDMNRFVGRTVDGLLGSDLLDDYVVTVNYAAQEVLLYRRDYVPIGGTALWLHDGLVDAILGDGVHTAPVQLKVDTGTKAGVHVSTRFLADHHLLESAPRVETIDVESAVPTQAFLARLASIKLGSTALGPIVIEATDERAPRGTTGSLGAELLEQFTVTFDYPHSRVLLAAREHPPFLGVDGSGLVVATYPGDTHRAEIISVVKGSPAANSGIEPETEIVAVGDVPFAQLGLAQLWSLLRQPGTLRLTLRQNGQDRVVALSLRPLL